MSEFLYTLFVVALIALGIAGLAWALLRFEDMSRSLGLFGYWGMAIPTTRLGMSAAMIGIVLIGLASLPPRLLFYPEGNREILGIAFIVVVFAGLIHDLAYWLSGLGQRGKRNSAKRPDGR